MGLGLGPFIGSLFYSLLDNNIFFASLGAAIQNIQLGVTAEGLTSAWLSGGGETQTNQELAEVLEFRIATDEFGRVIGVMGDTREP